MRFNELEHLPWDSRFFGYPVARIVLDPRGGAGLASLFDQMKAKRYRLTYLFVPPTETEMNDRIKKKGGTLVDQKTTFAKPSETHTDFAHDVHEYPGTDVNDRLRSLVLQAGQFSRFNRDGHFINGEYERLYIEWLRKSLIKSIALKVLVAACGSEIAGMTTLAKKRDLADISLVAVDKKFRGQGLGLDLIRYSDTIAKQMGFSMVQVVTQLQNEAAYELYQKCNFKIRSVSNVYHYWQ